MKNNSKIVFMSLAVLAVAILAASFVGWRSLGGRPRDYVLQFESASGTAGPVEVALFIRGQVHEKQSCEPSSGATFSLGDGKYEIDADACVDCGTCAEVCPVTRPYRRMKPKRFM